MWRRDWRERWGPVRAFEMPRPETMGTKPDMTVLVSSSASEPELPIIQCFGNYANEMW